MNHAHIVLILLQSYHTNTDRMYHICKKLYHICNFQRNLLENVRDMYTLRQIGISFSLKTDLRQPYGRDLSRSAHRVQYIAWHCISPPVVFIRIIIHNGFMISERDESHPYACRVVFFQCGAERDELYQYETMPFLTSSRFSISPSKIFHPRVTKHEIKLRKNERTHATKAFYLVYSAFYIL